MSISGQFVQYRGTLSLVIDQNQIQSIIKVKYLPKVNNPVAIANRENRNGKDEFHITVINPLEYKELTPAQQELVQSKMNKSAPFIDLGMAEVSRSESDVAYYVVVVSPECQDLRKRLGLGFKDLHITLGYTNGDFHGNINGYSLLRAVTFFNPSMYYLEFLDHINEFYSSNHMEVTGEQAEYEECMLIDILQVVSNDISAANPSLHHSSKYHKVLSSTERFSASKTITTLNNEEKLNILRKIGKIVLLNKYENILQQVGTTLLRAGLLLGMRVLLLFYAQRFHAIHINEFMNIVPVKILENSGRGKQSISRAVREFNDMVFTSNQSNGAYEMKRKAFCLERHATTGEEQLSLAPLPRNFSWARLPHHSGCLVNLSACMVAGSAIPSQIAFAPALHGVGIRLVLSLHEHPLPSEVVQALSRHDVQYLHYFVHDRQPPAKAQVIEMVRAMHAHSLRGDGVLVHCQGGVGRTNTAIIAYLMCVDEALSAASAIALVDGQRRMILSHSQQQFLETVWWRLIREEGNPLTDMTAADSDAQQEQHTGTVGETRPALQFSPMLPTARDFSKFASSLRFPPILMLCGLPASGKSTFAKALTQCYPENFVRINRDEMRGKGQCENALYDYLRPYLHQATKHHSTAETAATKVIVIDNCHVSSDKRREWIALAHRVPIWCIHFNRDVDDCRTRIQLRHDHPTIAPGSAGLRIIQSMLKQYEIPQTSEGFERVITVANDEQVRDLLCLWKVATSSQPTHNTTTTADHSDHSSDEEEAAKAVELSKPMKFPRTPHILNLGGMTRDDKMLASSDLDQLIKMKTPVIVEEKIDGANIGIWIRSSDNKVIVQNRSHFISSQYHPQFQLLNKWLDRHAAELWTILRPDRDILFGEWMYATHSVYYNALPDFFVAFDLFDMHTKQFTAREKLQSLLQQESTIPIVPLLYEGVITSADMLKSLVHGPSQYINNNNNNSEIANKREGIVMRVFDANREKLITRAKIVRGDFIAGNERWNRSVVLQTNALLPYKDKQEG